ncbi:MAG: transporter [Frankiales bacterium]|nr:transporter [Frankiales bacterium]
MGIVILLVMLVTVLLIISRRLPTLIGLVLLAVVVAFLGGAPVTGAHSVSDGVIAAGSIALASTMIAILLGSWLAAIMEETGIATTLVRKIVELGGESPYFVALGMFIAATLVGMVTGSAPAAMLVGLVGIPTMIAVGLPPTTSVGVILMGMAAGEPLMQTDWQFYVTTTHVPLSTVRSFGLSVFPIGIAVGIAFVLIESWRRGRVRAWALAVDAPIESHDEPPAEPVQRRRVSDAPWYSLLAPIVPIVFALGFDVAITTSLLLGVVYALITTTHPKQWSQRGLKTAYRGVEIAGPALLLYVAIGMILASVQLPTTVAKLKPYTSVLELHNVVIFVVVLAILVPLALYRGPLNLHGMGAGIASVLIASKAYAPATVLGMFWGFNTVQTASDPTTSQAAWGAGYAGVRTEQVMARTLPYTWILSIAITVVTAIRFF